MPLSTTPVTSVSFRFSVGYPSQETGPSQASPPCMGEGGNQDDTIKLSLQGQSWGDLEFWLPSLDLKKTLPPVSGAVVLNLWGLIPLGGGLSNNPFTGIIYQTLR